MEENKVEQECCLNCKYYLHDYWNCQGTGNRETDKCFEYNRDTLNNK